MQNYMHSHITYDEIILDQQSINLDQYSPQYKYSTQSRIKLAKGNKKDKPFWIAKRKNLQSYTTPVQNLTQNNSKQKSSNNSNVNVTTLETTMDNPQLNTNNTKTNSQYPLKNENTEQYQIHSQIQIQSQIQVQAQLQAEKLKKQQKCANNQSKMQKQGKQDDDLDRKSQNTIVYGQDFEFLDQELKQSLVAIKQPQKKQQVKQINRNMSDLLETQRKNNYSSILPKLNKKQSLSVPKQRQASSNRYTELSRYQTPKPKKQVAMVPQYESVTQINKSTLQLRQQNKRLVKSIQNYRQIIPNYRKNIMTLICQNQQLQKVKLEYARIYDIDYQYGLEKQVSQQLESIQDVAYQIRSVETFMRMKSASKNNTNKSMQDKSKNKSKDALDNRSKSILDRNKKNKALAISKISAQQYCDYQQQPTLLTQYIKLRQQILFKKRQEQIYTKKQQQAQQKLCNYYRMMEELQQRGRVGVHEELKRKKIVLEYDIDVVKTKIQQKECKLMLEIAEMNNQSSSMEVQIAKASEQIMELIANVQRHLDKDKNNKQDKLAQNISIKIENNATTSPKKVVKPFNIKQRAKQKQKQTQSVLNKVKTQQQEQEQQKTNLNEQHSNTTSTTNCKNMSRLAKLFGRKK